eukprot:TRINITY_DN21164_c0_g1_i2.p1 TRINITY_DN21164_c0_g1~~TRINITY_DN21164_c0_g1_i2.p1  ORF type:complete len:116 (-),score=9.23 TRINITY_DN21164_c0_g1_i2:110-457(-)
MLQNRAKAFCKDMPMAMANLRIAQHRDQLWYNKQRTNKYKAKQQKIAICDKVYRTKKAIHIFNSPVERLILAVVEVNDDTGTLTLQGTDEKEEEQPMTHCESCHLPALETDPYLN